MRINDKLNNVGNVQRPDVPREKSAEKPEAVEGAAKNDQVTVSEKAKEIAKLKAEVNKIPEIRADRVDEVKKAIDAGTYNVKGEAVAGKLIKEAIIDSIV